MFPRQARAGLDMPKSPIREAKTLDGGSAHISLNSILRAASLVLGPRRLGTPHVASSSLHMLMGMITEPRPYEI